MKSNKKHLPFISVQILNWNRAEETVRAIESIQNQTYKNFEIIIIDNGSTDNSVDLIRSKFPKIKILELNKNYGCPGGRNRGIEFCNGEYIFFCDNDGLLHHNALENAVRTIHSDDLIAVVTGTVYDFDEADEVNLNFNLPIENKGEINLFQGGISIHRKVNFSRVDMYPDDYIYGQEETYLSFRLIDAGYRIIKSNQVVLWHKKSPNARNLKSEVISAWANKLANAFQLYPLENFILFFLYYWIMYPFYALKNGFFVSFVKETPLIIKRLNNYKRSPVKRTTILKFKRLAKQE